MIWRPSDKQLNFGQFLAFQTKPRLKCVSRPGSKDKFDGKVQVQPSTLRSYRITQLHGSGSMVCTSLLAPLIAKPFAPPSSIIHLQPHDQKNRQ